MNIENMVFLISKTLPLSEQAEKLDQAAKTLFKKQEINLNIVENFTEFTKNMKEKC